MDNSIAGLRPNQSGIGQNNSGVTAAAFLEPLVQVVSPHIHTVLTDDGINFASSPKTKKFGGVAIDIPLSIATRRIG